MKQRRSPLDVLWHKADDIASSDREESPMCTQDWWEFFDCIEEQVFADMMGWGINEWC